MSVWKIFQRVIMGKWCLHASLFLGNKDMFKNYKRFDFWQVQTADIGGTKPWKNNCSLIWKLFKFLMTLLAGLFDMRGRWHIGLRWAIVALWATCLHCYLHSKLQLYFSTPDLVYDAVVFFLLFHRFWGGCGIRLYWFLIISFFIYFL